MATTTQKSGLTFKHKVGYAMGDLGGCMTFALMGAMVTRYYTNVLQVNTAVLATLLLVWNIWDAVNDPMMGALMDKMYAKHHNKNGKFRPWLLRAAPLLAITSIVFWTVPTLFDGYTMLVVLFFCKILYEGCYTMFNIPMGSLLSAMANTDGERAALSSARGFGSMIGNVIPMMILPQLLAKFGDTSKAFGIGAAIPAMDISLDSGIMDAVGIMAGVGSVLFIVVGIVFLITLFGNMVSWSFGVNFVAEHAARKKNMPKVFAHESEKNQMPTGAAIVNGVVASVLVLLSPVMELAGFDSFFWIFFSMNIVFLLISYIPMFPAFLKLRKIDPAANRVFKVPGGHGVALVVAWVPVILLVACNLIDYATGLMASKYRAQDINSYKSIRGIFKKVSMWLLVVVGAIIDEMLLYASTSIGWKSPVTFLVACVVAMWLICNEIISILENIQDMGVNIPAFMQPLVKHIRSQVEDQVKVDNDSEGE